MDNSIAVKWYLPEEYEEEALKVFHAGDSGEALLFAPAHIQSEFGNALWKRYQRGELSLDEVRTCWEDFDDKAPLFLFRMDFIMPGALEIAMHCAITVYDALYIALAQAQRGEGMTATVTADQTLLRKLAGTPYENLGVHIADVGDFLLAL